MRQTRITHFLGVALVLYLVAHAASFRQGLDPADTALAGLAVLLSLLYPFMLQRAGAAAPHRIGLLALAAAGVLVGGLRPVSESLALQSARVVALSAFAGLLSDLALVAPDRLRPLRRLSTWAPYGLAAASALAGLAALMPAVRLFGLLLLARPWVAAIPLGHAALSIVFALGVRLLRRQLGSDLASLTANTWAVLGLLPAAALTAALAAAWLAEGTAPEGLPRSAAVGAIAMFTVLGHVLMADGTRRLRAGAASRDAAAAALAMAAVGGGAALLELRVPEQPLLIVLSVAVAAAATAALFWLLRPVSHRWLAPYGGRLLAGIDQAIDRLAGCQSFAELGRAVLPALRTASGEVTAEPLLYALHPTLQVRIDAAGEPHLAERELSPALRDLLQVAPGEILIRRSLQRQIVRQPPLRPVVDALREMDALCAVPLCRNAELEGALLVPRGRRRSALTLEEVAALGRFSLFLTAFVSVLCSEERAQRRAGEAERQLKRASEREAELERQAERMRAQSAALKAAGAAERMRAAPVAYSEAMRELLGQIEQLAEADEPVLLVAAAGLEVEQLAFRLHRRSGRAEQGLLVGDCAAVSAERSGAALFGDEQVYSEYPGWLPLAEQGTLLLLDLPALPVEVQRSLGWSLASGQACRLNAEQPYAVAARVVATSRVPLEQLVQTGRFDAGLAGRFERSTLLVPPLQQRAEDLQSLLLGEIARACRVLGREPLGVEPEAARALEQHIWPDNLAGLRAAIEAAVAVTAGPRVRTADLPLTVVAAAPRQSEQVAGDTFEALERRILRHAIEHAGGNKSEAARMLGLKRTTFLDKLKRHGIESQPPPRGRI